MALLTWDALELAHCAQGVTDSTGRWILQEQPTDPEWTREEFILGPLTALSDPREVRFPADASPGEIRLQLEPTGSLDLEAVDARGQPLELEAEFSLEIVREVEEPWSVLGDTAWIESDSSRAHVPRVALGRRLRISAWTYEFRFEEAVIPGPRFEGERLRLRIPIKAARDRVRGRVITPEERPVAGTFHLELLRASGRSDWERIVSRHELLASPDGRFGEFDEIDLCDGTTWRLRGKLAGGIPLIGHTPLRPPSVDLSDQGRRIFDLGDVQLEQEPFLACGTVVDTSGSPVRDATIWVRPESMDPDVDWFRGATSDRDGEFSVQGSVPWRSLEACASILGQPGGEIVTAAVGSTGIRLVVDLEHAAPGSIRGRMLLPPGVEVDGLDWYLRPAGGDWRLRGTSSADDGRFLIGGLQAGRWSLGISLFEDEQHLVELTEIDVEAGKCIAVGPVDLRTHLRSVGIAVVDADGAPVDSANALPVSSGAFDSRSSEGHIRFWSRPERSLEVVVTAPGFRPRHVHALIDGETVRLERGIECRFLFPTGVVPPPSVEITLILEHLGSGLLEDAVGWLYASMDAQPVRLPLPGPYSLAIHPGLRGQGFGPPLSETRIEVLDDGVARDYEIPLDRATLEAYIRQL